MEIKERLAEQYAHNYFDMHETNNYKALKQGFLAGFSAKEEIIKERIKSLEKSKRFELSGLEKSFNNQQEQMRYAKKADEVIEILKSLLDEK